MQPRCGPVTWECVIHGVWEKKFTDEAERSPVQSGACGGDQIAHGSVGPCLATG